MTPPQILQNAPQTWNDPNDLAKCDNEAIQSPGAIMPHGVMLILSSDDYRVLGVSANTLDWLNKNGADLLGRQLDTFITKEVQQKLEAGLSRLNEAHSARFLGCIQTLHSPHRFDVFGHLSGDFIVLELESLATGDPENTETERFAELVNSITALQNAETWQEGMDLAVIELKRMTGFDSVIGVRMLEDGTGHAVAEAREPGFASFLDKRFPRSDIPEPARRQMLLMPVQYTPEHDYERVPLIMGTGELNSLKIDLSRSLLRSMSLMCSRYYMNMGARSRLLLVLINQGQLWGFFSCLSATPRQVTYADRLTYQMFAEMATLLLVEKVKFEYDRESLLAKHLVTELIDELSTASIFPEALNDLPSRLPEIVDISGSALIVENNITCTGLTPEIAAIKNMIPWLEEQDNFVATDQFPSLYAPAKTFSDKATGLIAVRLIEPGEYLLGFRSEWVHEVRWAGDPRKPVQIDDESGDRRLTPRGSFEVWKEVVSGKARPWLRYETEALGELQRGIILLQLLDKRHALTLSLQRSNADLETFAYAVSHDLQEPLRGILKTSSLLNDEANRHSPVPQGGLDTIIKLSSRMSEMIHAVLQYSRAGQEPVNRESVNLNELLQMVQETLSLLIDESGTKVIFPGPLPWISCDPIRTSAIFQNLIANAIKFNDSVQKQIEIGCLEGSVATFFVRDNGIGIPPQHQENIFTIFRRLHPRDAYGGGSGAGLTLTRKHIEKHGGRLWLESSADQGTTFFFTLNP
jgi:light-regulated signal transduction histidine kinase (bacteriophytochrome)